MLGLQAFDNEGWDEESVAIEVFAFDESEEASVASIGTEDFDGSSYLRGLACSCEEFHLTLDGNFCDSESASGTDKFSEVPGGPGPLVAFEFVEDSDVEALDEDLGAPCRHTYGSTPDVVEMPDGSTGVRKPGRTVSKMYAGVVFVLDRVAGRCKYRGENTVAH